MDLSKIQGHVLATNSNGSNDFEIIFNTMSQAVNAGNMDQAVKLAIEYIKSNAQNNDAKMIELKVEIENLARKIGNDQFVSALSNALNVFSTDSDVSLLFNTSNAVNIQKHIPSVSNVSKQSKEKSLETPDKSTIEQWEKDALAGDNEVIFKLGQLCHKEDRVFEAKLCWEKAAGAGHIQSMLSLGLLFCKKEAIKNLDITIYWWGKAAECGNNKAMFNLGVLFHKEKSVKNPLVARTWYNKAIESGHNKAGRQLKVVNLEIFNIGWEFYKTNKFAEAIFHWEMVAENGDTKAMFALGFLYQQAVQAEKSIFCWEKATDKWDYTTTQNLEYVFKQHEEIHTNNLGWWNETIGFWENLTQTGDNKAKAMFVLGCIYMSDFIDDRACEWWENAAKEGSNKAMFALGCYYEGQADNLIPAEEYNLDDGTTGRKYRKIAKEWMYKAAVAGNPEAIAKVSLWRKEKEYYKKIGQSFIKSELERKGINYLLVAKQADLFLPNTPSAYKVTNIPFADGLFKLVVQKGWRWIFPGVIDSGFDPVVKARQIPELLEGDWVVVRGKTLRLIKANDNHNSSLIIKLSSILEEEALQKKMEDMVIQDSDNATVEGLPIINLPKDFFKDDYARVTGAYIRHLERFKYLKPIFKKFFNINTFGYTNVTLRHSQVDKLVVSLYGRNDVEYLTFQEVTLNDTQLTVYDLEELNHALGLHIDPAVITTGSTIASTLPFKKVLELLTCYDPRSKIPMWVFFKIADNQYIDFLLTPDDMQPDQLIVSMQTEYSDRVCKFTGSAYPWWMNNYYNSGAPVNAQNAHLILTQPLEQSKVLLNSLEKGQRGKTVEFIACTQIVEDHAIPGRLKTSRTPGSGKLARHLAKNAADKGYSLSTVFVAEENKPIVYPAAGTGGTGNIKNAVNKTIRNSEFEYYDNKSKNWKTRGNNNAPDYDMSDDSDIDLDYNSDIESSDSNDTNF
ncbi:MAG: hypothetical protein ACK5WP_09405 [Neisseriaceae bacterium]